jgi:hypothetical protein
VSKAFDKACETFNKRTFNEKLYFSMPFDTRPE